MKKTNEHIESPALGCKVGQAYQIMLSQLSRALSEAGLGITTNEYLVLRAIYSRPGIQQCEIAEMVGKDKASVCRCVSGLDKKGLIYSESVSHKCLKVFPSNRAKEMEPKLMAVANLRHQALTTINTTEELDIFTRVLDNIINSK